MTTTLETPLGVRLPSLIPHWPHPPQEAFLWLENLEALYGGAAGGGKSDALLIAALQYIDVPGYAALLLRKTFADLNLPGAIMNRSQAWLAGTSAKWNDNEKQWTFPSGATLTFGYLQTSNDRYRYQGAEFQFIGFDELTQFDEADYSYLLSRLRRPAEGILSQIPLRMRAASNPGGKGHRWVKRRFIDRAPAPDDPLDTPERCAARVFVPARLIDNPSVDQDAYTQALSGLDPQTRKQLLDGDWNARQPGLWVYDQDGIDAAEALGARMDRLLHTGHLDPPEGYEIHLGIDWGLGTTAGLVIWPLPGGGIYIPPGEVIEHRGEPVALTHRMLASARAMPWPISMACYDSAGGQQMATFAEIADGVVSYPVAFNKRKKRAVGFLRELFKRTADGETTRVIAVSPTNLVLLEQLRGLRQDDKGEVLKEEDHAPDALIAGVSPIAMQFPDPDAIGADHHQVEAQTT